MGTMLPVHATECPMRVHREEPPLRALSEREDLTPGEVLMSLLKIAHVPPATVEPGATVFEAVSVMAREGVGAVAVVEKAAKSQLQGIFTERDVMLRVVQQERKDRKSV